MQDSEGPPQPITGGRAVPARAAQSGTAGALKVRQSVKAIVFGYTLCLAAEVAIAGYWIVAKPQSPPAAIWASLSIPLVLVLFIAIRHIRRRMTRMIITADRLTYEAGLFSKTVHVVELVKVQDVKVDQSITQRMFNIGDISIETAGGSSRIAMASIDNPRKVTEQILMMAQGAR